MYQRLSWAIWTKNVPFVQRGGGRLALKVSTAPSSFGAFLGVSFNQRREDAPRGVQAMQLNGDYVSALARLCLRENSRA